MSNLKKTDLLSYILIIGFFIFILEISFFDPGLIFSLLISGICLYFGKKKWNWFLGKVLFAIGALSLFFTIIGSFTFRFLLLASIVYFFILFTQTKQNPSYIRPEIAAENGIRLVKHEQKWFQNKLLGRQKTPEHSYTWEDVNIQTGIGDTIIDLSYTVLPKGESVIFIRNVVGNIQILVPYELDISVNHSVMVGSTVILEEEESKQWNRTVHFQTSGYEESSQKIKIITSCLVGSLEVKRV
ncbi:cell wall-active antibiotics response protein LiaF [Bacillus tianshenii]|uniref:cell wall-active antibiotics response protein LiaF n=1 Tax=Sutcliffiella tianshenii TaxID=1463404 RepID=UPI001CD491CC|nr:cell wall-active antibiotics response protein LiaF [Bacillus tianshenii]MCA1321840.1 cell wall-active antibiotics response protein LiaF [Bacillus tianshenii]